MHSAIGDNIFTPENLLEIALFELKVYKMEQFNNTCLAASRTNTSCNDYSFLTPLLFFLQAGLDIPTITQEEIDAVLIELYTGEDWDDYKIFFESTFGLDSLKSKFTRTLVMLAGPLNVDGR